MTSASPQTPAPTRNAAATHPGRRRTKNEDRFLVIPEAGIFAVIDGVGGHAAGERAADLAVEVIRERLLRPSGTPEERLREAIALANNEIFRLSRTRTEWNGMACVLTVALVEDGTVTVGHVGDSRLYLLHAGAIRKITKDHSPVGEREDRGELSEADAMRHARRNEIYRDVGAGERRPDDTDFIDISQFAMTPDAALLLCSDGLTDLVSSAAIRLIVEKHAADLHVAAGSLIDAANHAGGKDNVTVVLVAGPEYRPTAEPTRLSAPQGRPNRLIAFAFVLGLAVAAIVVEVVPILAARFNTAPRTYAVIDTKIANVLAKAHAGDTVVLLPGTYREPLELREGIAVRAQQPGTAILLGPVTAKNLLTGSLEGVAILADSKSPRAAGVQLTNASVTLSNVSVMGAITGIAIDGNSEAVIRASRISNNSGTGIDIAGSAKPRLEGNLIAANGNAKPTSLKPGVEVREQAKPVLKDNAIVNNGAEAVWVTGGHYNLRDFEENYFGPVAAKKAIREMESTGAKP